MAKAKISHIISDSNIGGAGVLLTSLTAALKDFFDIAVFLPKGARLAEPLSHAGATVYQVPMAADRSFRSGDVQGFFSVFKDFKADIAHTHGALSARLGARLAGVRRCISTRHCATHSPSVSRKNVLQRRVYNFCTDLTVSTADFATKNLIAEGIPEEKIFTIKNGVKERERTSAEERAALRQKLGIPENAVILGCCARLETVKGQDLIISAMPWLLKRFPRIFLLLVGDGSRYSDLKRLAAGLGVLPRVKFSGFVENPAPYQNIFDINLNTSRGTETSCLAISECMSLGIPTVASDFGGNTEMISPYENGLLFTSDDSFSLCSAISELMRSRSLYTALSQGAYDIYKRRFSIERMRDDYISLYSRLLS